MPTIDYSIETPYSPEQMFALVSDIARYKEFVPACADSFVEQTARGVFGTIVLSAGVKRESFTTCNTAVENQRIDMQLISGAFNALEGYWLFEAQPDDGCRVTIHIEYELPLLYRLMDGYFRSTITSMVSAFKDRATQIYGVLQSAECAS